MILQNKVNRIKMKIKHIREEDREMVASLYWVTPKPRISESAEIGRKM